jgi:hypothetical protein
LFEGIKAGAPESPVGDEPVIELPKGFGRHPVEATLRLDPRLDQPRITQHPEVFGDGRLAYPEPVHQLAHGALPLPEEIQDPAPGRFRQDVEGGCHEGLIYCIRYILVQPYTMQLRRAIETAKIPLCRYLLPTDRLRRSEDLDQGEFSIVVDGVVRRTEAEVRGPPPP